MQWDDLFSHVVDYDPATAEFRWRSAPSSGRETSLDSPAKLPTGGGVYLLTDAQDRLIQLASAADLKRAILNRLVPGQAATEKADTAGQPGPAESPEGMAAEAPDESDAPRTADAAAAESKPASAPAAGLRRRADLSQIIRRIRWQPAYSAFQITYEYLRIARVVLPTTYLKNVAFGPAWFVHVDPAAAIPRFTIGKVVQPGPGTILGPFSTQSDANKFVQVLEDVFDLCRYLHILEQVPHGQPCAYYEMGRCPAPCGGLIPMSQYRDMVAAALRFAAGDRQGFREQWEAEMRESAGALAFECAAAIKQRIDRAKGLDHAAYRFVRPIEQFSWIIVQRGGGRTWLQPFFVRAGRLTSGEPVRIKELEAVLPRWIEAFREGAPADSEADRDSMNAAGLQEMSEHLWLVSHFLFRREQTGLFFDVGQLPEPTQLAEAIREYFARPSPPGEQPEELGAETGGP